MTKDEIDLLIYPPAIIGPDTVILSPPLGSVAEYMQYLSDHAEDYRRFLGLDDE